MNLKGKKINFLGDSITEGAAASKPENTYHQLLKAEAGLLEARNYGIGGTRIARQAKPSVVERYDKYFASRIDEMEEDADIIVVFGGTNDWGHGDAPLGNMEDRTPDTFYGACHDLYQRLINKYTEKTIVVVTPLHRENEAGLRGEGKLEKDYAPLKRYVEIIREVAEYYSLPVCDLYAISGLQPELPVIKEKYCADGLHPNDAGHKIICQRLKGFLETL